MRIKLWAKAEEREGRETTIKSQTQKSRGGKVRGGDGTLLVTKGGRGGERGGDNNTTSHMQRERDTVTEYSHSKTEGARGEGFVCHIRTFSKKKKVEHFVFSLFFRLCFRGKTSCDVNGLSGCLFFCAATVVLWVSLRKKEDHRRYPKKESAGGTLQEEEEMAISVPLLFL